MRRSKASFGIFIVLGLLFSMALYGCSGGDGDDGDEPEFNVTGRFTGSFRSNRGGTGNVVANFTQSGNSVTGDRTTTAISGGFLSCSPATIDATISGDKIEGKALISQAGGGGVSDFNANISQNGNFISGTYRVSGGLCNGDSGTFDLTRTS